LVDSHSFGGKIPVVKGRGVVGSFSGYQGEREGCAWVANLGWNANNEKKESRHELWEKKKWDWQCLKNLSRVDSQEKEVGGEQKKGFCHQGQRDNNDVERKLTKPPCNGVTGKRGSNGETRSSGYAGQGSGT